MTQKLCACGCGQVVLTGNRFIFNHQGKKGPNKAEHTSDGVTILAVERRDGTTLQCLIDTADYPLVKQYRWVAWKSKRTFYVSTVFFNNGVRETVLLHKVLLPDAKEVDHENHNGLDNRRSNLRPATGSQNSVNRRKRLSDSRARLTSKFKGVGRHHSKFRASITTHGKLIYLGRFDSPEDAARAYDTAATKYFGEFANLNFPSRAHVAMEELETIPR